MLCVKCGKLETIRDEFKYCIVCRDETGRCWRCTENPRYETHGELQDCCRDCLIILDGACVKCGGPSDGTDTHVCYTCDPQE